MHRIINLKVVKSITFKEASEKWFQDYASLFLKRTSLVRNRQLTKRVYAVFGETPIDKITKKEIQSFINSLAREGVNEITGKALAYKTRKHYLTYISDVFTFCANENIIKDNVCKNVLVCADVYGNTNEKEIYSITEIKKLMRLIDNSAPEKYKCFFYLALYSGLRRGELMGLEWNDIDFENNLIHVKRTSNYTSKTGIYTDTTKTKHSKRCIKIPPMVCDILNQFKENNRYTRLFVQNDGTAMNNNTPYTWLRRFCKRNDIAFHGIHTFRHLYASILINSGVDVTTVSRCLGHSQTSTTLDIYSHTFAEAQMRSCDAIVAALDSTLANNSTKTHG